MDLTGARVHPGDRPSDQDLSAQPVRLLQRTTPELVSRYARRETKVVLDPGRRSGLATGNVAFDHDRTEALRSSVHGCGQTGRPSPHDHRVVPARGGLRAEAEELGHPAQAWPDHSLPAD